MYMDVVHNIQYREGVRKAQNLPRSLKECQDRPRLSDEMEDQYPPFGGRPKATWSFNWVEDTREHPMVVRPLT